MSEELDTEEVKAEARSMGWIDKEKFPGDPSKWRPAHEFLERGRDLLPIVRANNKKLETQLRATQAQLQEANGELAGMRESIDELTKFHQENTERAVKAERKRLAAELKSAREDGNTERELEIMDEIEDLKKPATATKPDTKAGTDGDDIKPHPDLKQWLADNDWFGVDEEKTALTNLYAAQLRKDPKNSTLEGRAFFDKAAQMAEEKLNPPGRGTSKVEPDRGGSGSGGGSDSTSKGYAALSDEAKRACEAQSKKMVGANRPFKTIEDWRKYFAEQYKGE